jgi:hypothetical protein
LQAIAAGFVDRQQVRFGRGDGAILPGQELIEAPTVRVDINGGGTRSRSLRF